MSLGPTTGSLLGTRNITYSVTPSGATVDTVGVNISPYGSKLSEASDNAAAPDVQISYSGFDVSLTGNTLTLHDYGTDGNGEQVQAWFDTTSGTLSSNVELIGGNHSGDLTLTLSNGSGDLSHVTGIRVEIKGSAGADFQLHAIDVVPEPRAYGALTALGLLGTVIWRRTRKA